MRTAILTALLAFTPLVGLADDAQPAQAASQQQQQQPQKQQEQKPAQQQPPAGTPVSISPMVPVAPPTDVAPGSPSPDVMAAGRIGAKAIVAAPVNSRTYVIGAEDIIGVSVFENVAFSVLQEAVRPDGKITMPLLGEIVAASKTPEELADEIQKILVDRYMKEPPHVQVLVIDVRSKNYYLNGEVNKPGKYPLVVPTTVMQALVNAGGFRDFANKKNIKIQRGNQNFKFNYNEVSKGKNLKQDIFLQPDDRIYVN